MELFELTALELGAAIRKGEVSIPEAARAALAAAGQAEDNASDLPLCSQVWSCSVLPGEMQSAHGYAAELFFLPTWIRKLY